MKVKTIFAAAAIATAALCGASGAATLEYGGFSYTPSNSPFNLEVFSLEVDSVGTTSPGANNSLTDGSSLGGNLVNNDSSGTSTSAGGQIAFKFTNTYDGQLLAVNFSTSNPQSPFSGLEIAWYDGFDGTNFTGKEVSITEPLDDVPLSTIFGTQGQMKYLVASWDSVSGSNSDIDFDIVSSVPVPAGILLMGTALAGFGVMRRKAKKAS